AAGRRPPSRGGTRRTNGHQRRGAHERQSCRGSRNRRLPSPPVADVIAVDVGGTKLSAGLVHDNGTLSARVDAPTPREGDAEVLFGTLIELVDALDRSGACAVGAGCGGPMDAHGEHVSPLNIPAWRAFPLR